MKHIVNIEMSGEQMTILKARASQNGISIEDALRALVQNLREEPFDMRTQADPWVEPITAYCRATNGTRITMREVFALALGCEYHPRNAGKNKRVVRILRSLGYERYQVLRPNGHREWVYDRRAST